MFGRPQQFFVQSAIVGVIIMLQVLKLDAQMQKLAEELKHESSLLVFGRGYNYATALEAALKVGTETAAHWPINKYSMRAFW